MRKLLAVLLCALSLFALLTGCDKAAETPEKNRVFVGTIEEVSENSLLVTAAAEEAGFTKAIITLAPEANTPDFTPLPGQTALFTVLPKITEGYPVGVSAVSIEFVSGPITSRTTVLRTGCFDGEEWQFLTSHSKNIEEGKSKSFSMPLLLFSSREELTAFIEDGSAYDWMDAAQSRDTFAADVKPYDEAFFTEKRLVVLYIWDTVMGIRYEVSNVSIAGNTLSVRVDMILPPPDRAMAQATVGYFCFVEIGKNIAAPCTEFQTYTRVVQE